MNTENNQVNTAPKHRGRPRKPFTFPSEPFLVKDLAEQLKVSVPLVHLKIREAGAKIKVVDTQVKGRGRGANVYQYSEPQGQTNAAEDFPDEEETEAGAPTSKESELVEA